MTQSSIIDIEAPTWSTQQVTTISVSQIFNASATALAVPSKIPCVHIVISFSFNSSSAENSSTESVATTTITLQSRLESFSTWYEINVDLPKAVKPFGID